jgi:uncharacterized protein
MNLKDKINDNMKSAMKSGDKIRLETVRSIRALILEFEKSGANKQLNPEDEIKLLSTAVKKRKESIEQYEKAGRNDLVEKEQAELNILMEYMPKQLSVEEIQKEISRIANELGAKTKEDFPKLMPAVMKELKGKADGKIVKQEVENYLGKA